MASGSFMASIVGIWIADVESQVKPAERVHLAGTDMVKPFRCPPVPLTRFGPHPHSPVGADRILPEQLKCGSLPKPYFKNFLGLEHPDENRGAPLQAFTRKRLPKGSLVAQNRLPGACARRNIACKRLHWEADCQTEQPASPFVGKAPPTGLFHAQQTPSQKIIHQLLRACHCPIERIPGRLRLFTGPFYGDEKKVKGLNQEKQANIQRPCHG